MECLDTSPFRVPEYVVKLHLDAMRSFLVVTERSHSNDVSVWLDITRGLLSQPVWQLLQKASLILVIVYIITQYFAGRLFLLE